MDSNQRFLSTYSGSKSISLHQPLPSLARVASFSENLDICGAQEILPGRGLSQRLSSSARASLCGASGLRRMANAIIGPQPATRPTSPAPGRACRRQSARAAGRCRRCRTARSRSLTGGSSNAGVEPHDLETGPAFALSLAHWSLPPPLAAATARAVWSWGGDRAYRGRLGKDRSPGESRSARARRESGREEYGVEFHVSSPRPCASNRGTQRSRLRSPCVPATPSARRSACRPKRASRSRSRMRHPHAPPPEQWAMGCIDDVAPGTRVDRKSVFRWHRWLGPAIRSAPIRGW